MDLRSTFLKFLLSHYYSSWLLTMQKTTRILRRCVARWASVYIHLHTNLLINKIFNTFLFCWVVDESDALVPQIVLCNTHNPVSLLGLWIESPGMLCSSLHFWWLKQVKWTDDSLLWFRPVIHIYLFINDNKFFKFSLHISLYPLLSAETFMTKKTSKPYHHNHNTSICILLQTTQGTNAKMFTSLVGWSTMLMRIMVLKLFSTTSAARRMEKAFMTLKEVCAQFCVCTF